jgi:hypothetical protein
MISLPSRSAGAREPSDLPMDPAKSGAPLGAVSARSFRGRTWVGAQPSRRWHAFCGPTPLGEEAAITGVTQRENLDGERGRANRFNGLIPYNF